MNLIERAIAAKRLLELERNDMGPDTAGNVAWLKSEIYLAEMKCAQAEAQAQNNNKSLYGV